MIGDKKLKKVLKILGDDMVELMLAQPPAQLKSQVVQAESIIQAAESELEANVKYQALKEDLKHLRASFGDLKKLKKAEIVYALHLLGEKE